MIQLYILLKQLLVQKVKHEKESKAMSEKSRTKGVTRSVRKNISIRNERQQFTSKKGEGRGTSSTPIFTPSFSTLKLKSIKSVEITFKNKDAEEIEKLNSIFDVLWHTYKLVSNNIDAENLLSKDSQSIDLSILKMLDMIREHIPEKAEINIEYEDYPDENNLVVVIYQYARTEEGLQTFDIHRVVKKLEQYNPKLLNLFYIFLNSFSNKVNINLWYRNTFDYDISEQLCNEVDDYTNIEERDEVLNQIWEYSSGPVKSIEDKIRNSQVLEHDVILWHLRNSKFDMRNPIVNLIKQGCELMSYGLATHHFDYFPEFHCDDWFGLRYPDQSVIYYDGDDHMSQKMNEYIDAYSYEGVAEPHINMAFNLETETFNGFENWEEKVKFPMRLCKFFDAAHELIKKYTFKQIENDRNYR